MNWAAIGAAVLLLRALFGPPDSGIVIIEAGPGMCEADTSWVWSAYRESPANPASRFDWAPPSATCVRLVFGVPPGVHVVALSPADRAVPSTSHTLKMAPGGMATVKVPAPAARISGRVTAHGRPVPGVELLFAMAREIRAAMDARDRPYYGTRRIVTDAEGQYRASAWTAGPHRVAIRAAAGRTFSERLADVTLVEGHQEYDIELGGSRVRVFFTEKGGSVTPGTIVSVSLQSLPRTPLVLDVKDASQPLELDTLEAGRYVVAAHGQGKDENGSPRWFAASRAQELTVTATSVIDITVDLVTQDATLQVVTPTGEPVEGASVFPLPLMASLTTDRDGRVSLATVPVGKQLPIRTRTFGMSCHTVTHDSLQRATVNEASEEVTFVWSLDPRELKEARSSRPQNIPMSGALIHGVSGASCPVPWESLSAGVRRQPDRWEVAISLPPGGYTMTMRDGRVVTFTAPGKVEIKDVK